MYKAALFDLDGVVFNTEPQYSLFWESQFHLYYPGSECLAQKIKGQTLVQIYDKYFNGKEKEQADITNRLNEFEQNMRFVYIDGYLDFIKDLRNHNLSTAVVTSSNKEKMENVYRNHHEFISLFDVILTAEDFSKSKPDPECYLKGASSLGFNPKECVGFEDSFNGLKSLKAAEMTVVGLATTNTSDSINSYSDIVIKDYVNLDYEKMVELITQSH